MHVCIMDVSGHMCCDVVWRTENSFVALVLSFHFYVGSGNLTQVAWLTQQASLSTESSYQPLSHVSLMWIK